MIKTDKAKQAKKKKKKNHLKSLKLKVLKCLIFCKFFQQKFSFNVASENAKWFYKTIITWNSTELSTLS